MRQKLTKLFKGKFEQEHRKEHGIYSIYFKGKSDFYIGSTNSKEGFERRWRDHVYRLRNNKHANTIMQRTYNKYGESAMKFEIIEIFEGSNEQLIEREQFYIDFFKPGLNINQVAEGCVFPKGWVSPQAKPILQYDLDGNFIREFSSISDAEAEINGDIRQAIKHLSEYSTQAGGFQWRYKESDNFERKILKYKYNQETIVLCYDSNGNFHKEYQSISKASEDLNIPIGNISRAITGDRNAHSAYGYFFKEKKSDDYPMHIDELLRVHKEQFCVDVENLETGEKFHFDSIRQISKGLINRSLLRLYMKKGLMEFVAKKKLLIKITKL